MKKYKFLLVPNTDNPYDKRMMKSFGCALESFGHSYHISKCSELSYLEDCLVHSPDVVLAVNKNRPKNRAIKGNIIYLSWFQDVYPETSDGLHFEGDDILYILGTPEQLGIKLSGLNVPIFSLYTGVGKLNEVEKKSDLCDFSLCGGLPLDIEYPERYSISPFSERKDLCSIIIAKLIIAKAGRNFLGMNYDNCMIKKCKAIVEREYKPLTGTLDINDLYDLLLNTLGRESTKVDKADKIILSMLNLAPNFILKKIVTESQILKIQSLQNTYTNSKATMINALASWMAQSYPRIIERRQLVSFAESVSDNIQIYGNHMENFDFSKRYFMGVLTSEQALASVYANSRINLGNNTHGLGLHSRNLGVMAAGGYLLHHRSHNNHPGSMENEFEEGNHYDSYGTIEEFKFVSTRALSDEKRRRRIGELAKNYVFQNHTWEHRAFQVLNDLGMSTIRKI